MKLVASGIGRNHGAELRKNEADGRRIITYCAGCVQALGGHTPTNHLVDILFAPDQTLAGKKKGAGAPFTYLNRLRLKRAFKRKEGFAVTRERTFVPEQGQPKKRSWKPLIFLTLLVAAVAGVHLSGAAQYLQQDRLRELIAGYGALAPAIYILIYALAPVLFLPGLPITIAGRHPVRTVLGRGLYHHRRDHRRFPGIPGGALRGPRLGGGQADRSQVGKARQRGGPARLEGGGLHPPDSGLPLQPVELRLRTDQDPVCPLCGCHLCLHAAGLHRLHRLLQLIAGTDQRERCPQRLCSASP